jgi:anti-sigma B factor antagonist
MIIKENVCNNITTINLWGTLDATTAPTLRNFKSAAAPADPVVINMSDVDFLDSSGLGALVGLTREKREQGGEVTLACMNNKVRKVFEITQVYRLFDIYDDVEAATINAEKKQTRL